MKKTALLLALTCALLAAPAMFAQAPAADAPPENVAAHGQRMIQHRVAFMTTVLSLTTAQQAQVKSVLTAAVANGSTTHGSMKTAHDNLKTAIHANDAAGMEQDGRARKRRASRRTGTRSRRPRRSWPLNAAAFRSR